MNLLVLTCNAIILLSFSERLGTESSLHRARMERKWPGGAEGERARMTKAIQKEAAKFSKITDQFRA